MFYRFVSVPPLEIFKHCRTKLTSHPVVSFGLLIGTPISGQILAATGFTETWIFGGGLIMAGCLVIAASRVVKSGWSLRVKV